MRRASEAQRERLHCTFEALCRLASPSRHERACADWVIRELEGMGLSVQEDDAARALNGDTGNLLTRVEGNGERSVLLCAHLDTVPPIAPIVPVLREGRWQNGGDGILGADNKAAVAVMLELVRGVLDSAQTSAISIELLFTVGEETGLDGAKHFDSAVLQSQFGYVFDHPSPVGEIVMASPTYHRIDAEVHGRAAHAGVEPERGRNAIAAAARAVAEMRLGRIDERTTANVGVIAGGTAANVVPDSCRLEAEARGIDDAEVEAVVTEMIDHLQQAANASECDLDVIVQHTFKGYRNRPRAQEVVHAERALRACGYEPRHIFTGGGSDANALRAAGFPCINLANGTEHNHEPDERVSVEALEGMLEVAIALLEDQEPGP